MKSESKRGCDIDIKYRLQKRAKMQKRSHTWFVNGSKLHMKKILRNAKCLSGEMVSAPISSKFEIFHNSIFSQCERVFQKLKFKTHYWVKIKFYVKYDLVRGDDFLHPAFVPNLGSLSLQKIINGVCGVQGQASLSPQVCIYSRRSDGTTMVEYSK